MVLGFTSHERKRVLNFVRSLMVAARNRVV
jgi:hypothetical protein